VFAFARGRSKQLLVIANADMEHTHNFTVTLQTGKRTLTDLFSGKKYSVAHHQLTGSLSAGEVVLFLLGSK
jgi:hypothetical protein